MGIFGLGSSIQNSSNVANTAESRAYNEKMDAQQQKEALPTGLGAVASIAKSVAPTAAQIVNSSKEMNDTATLQKVTDEANNSSLLTDEETKLIYQQLNSGNSENASKILFSVLPSRRADQMAVQYIQSNLLGDINAYQNSTAEGDEKTAKLTKDNLMRKITAALLTMSQPQQEALKNRLPDNLKQDFERTKNERGALTLDERTELERIKQENALDLIEKRNENAKETDERRSEMDLSKKASTKVINLTKDVIEETAPIKDAIDDLNSYNGNLVGFTKKYLSSIGLMATPADNSEEAQIAMKQQQTFMALLNRYMKAISGAAVTQQEAARLLAQFGLSKFSASIIPNPSSGRTIFADELKNFILEGLRQNSSIVTPDNIVFGINGLRNMAIEQVNLAKETYGPYLIEDHANKINTSLERLTAIPELKPSIKFGGDYDNAVNAQKVVDVAKKSVRDLFGNNGEQSLRVPPPTGNSNNNKTGTDTTNVYGHGNKNNPLALPPREKQ